MKKLSLILFLVLAMVTLLLLWEHQGTKREDNKIPKLNQSTVVQTSLAPDPCLDLNLPANSYETTGNNLCLPKSEYIDQINLQARFEREEGDSYVSTYIKNAYETNGKIYIDVDEIEFPVCKNSFYPSPEDAPECGPNGYLLTNTAESLNTHELDSSVKIRLMEDYGSILDLQPLTAIEFVHKKNKHNQSFFKYTYDGLGGTEYVYPVFDLIFKNGKIIYIHQIYLP